MLINKITSDLINTVILEIKKRPNMSKIQNDIVDPIVNYAFRKLYPYMIITSVLFFFIFIIALSILIFVLRTESTGGSLN